jgi:[FeFe] hydrogenase H-cluster maturation GTPase HydF
MKPHIGIFGRRNNGKSSIINALAGQNVAIVSEKPGTTTDPVRKTIEINGIGPVILIDTAGIDDVGNLGTKRIDKAVEILKIVDAAILVINNNEFGKPESELIEKLISYDIPYLIVHNKSDLNKFNLSIFNANLSSLNNQYQIPVSEIIDFSTINIEQQSTNISNIIYHLKKIIPASAYQSQSLIGDLLSYGDTVLLITPIDIEAPEGRLILPQVQVIRDILDNDGVAVVIKEREIDSYIKKMNPKPKLVITDSQVFLKADAAIPEDIPLTSFSIVLARNKGDFNNYIKGTPYISKLKDNDKVLILESCSHHVSCDDIGRVKIPRWLTNFTGKKLNFQVISGLDKLPVNLNEFSLVVQCGGCMITRKQLHNRLKPFIDASIPVTNYGMTIAYVHGIYNRAISPFTNNAKLNIDYL